ncbi:MAG: methylated-DNA--[protein]-cysteine S-methyltransferase [Deltaproteobacteria bacterium]|nr:methylated-DNA--[protein]-cysteine S-methyltransferase [Deltaproteobacteria bacterium]
MARKDFPEEIFCWSFSFERLTMLIASSRKGAVGLGVILDEKPDCSEYFHAKFPQSRIMPDEGINADLILAVKGALQGKKVSEVLPLDISGTEFQMKVWKMIAKIPFGETRTYGEVALMAGKPGGARAIGQVMHRNPLPIIFPCHRVVAASGIGGFGGGLTLKRYLLDRERI